MPPIYRRRKCLSLVLFILCLCCLSTAIWLAVGPSTLGVPGSGLRDRWSFPYKTIVEPTISTEWTKGHEVLMGVTSSPKYRLKRDAIRATWATHPRFRVVFFLGVTRGQLMQDIIGEAEQFGDIVIYDFVDHYINLTLKTAGLILWADKHRWMERTHVFKVHDDVFVNTKVLLRHLPQFYLPGMYGNLRVGHEPVRDILSPWYLSPEEYPAKSFPPHLLGCIYMIHEETLKTLVDYLFQSRFNFIEDVYLTGLVTEIADIELRNVPKTAAILDAPDKMGDSAAFRFVGNVNLDLTNVLAVHYVEPDLQREFWKRITSQS